MAAVGPRIFLVAGEVSGDIYGADLVAALRRFRPDVDLPAVGGPRMAAAGARLLLDSSGWGVVGWLEVLPRLPAFLARLSRVHRAIAAAAPRAVVLIDFPGFNLALARRLQGRVPVAYFLPPMVSTRRGRRACGVAKLGLRLLAAFPFEAQAYRAAGADVRYVGHPAVDRVRPSAPPEVVRSRLGIPLQAPLLALLPGSRRQELRRHLPVIAGALASVRARLPALRAVLLLAAPHYRTQVEAALRPAGLQVTVVEGGTQAGYDALASSDFAVIASGTATLEALCLGIPGVVIYKTSRLDYWIARRIAAVQWAGLPSLLAGREVMPELLQDALTPRRLAATLADWLADTPRRTRQQEELRALRLGLADGGAAERAAAEVLRLARLLGREGSSTIQTI
ncbi:MAG: lipid-A-disaccharide synthase [Armatimonadota bacterium]|nr:lipid-A-disaccharide synthase [Armatimonadota bacterium]MDR7426449.1 lipid-A-disaccharide synthase [Armatimonadota bacterium]MDR7464686.1 lipid-A-disaccharide synthase [Armatimonadota bacterium]MDR7470255.1 lipid-A-disaccharide synthase [Armatimonadota bacterium]MDR7473412.1 lipid-A-disaccharide synthase [Armatimonadota bacterium]